MTNDMKEQSGFGLKAKKNKKTKSGKPSFLAVLFDSSKGMAIALVIFSVMTGVVFLIKQAFAMTGIESGDFTNWIMSFSKPTRFAIVASILVVFITLVGSFCIWLGADESYYD